MDGLRTLGLISLVVLPVCSRGGDRAATVLIDSRTGVTQAVSPPLGPDLGAAGPQVCDPLRRELAGLVGEMASSYAEMRVVAARYQERAFDPELQDQDRQWRVKVYGLKQRLYEMPTCTDFRTIRAVAIRLWRDLSDYQDQMVAATSPPHERPREESAALVETLRDLRFQLPEVKADETTVP
jgi:hypothetical protein